MDDLNELYSCAVFFNKKRIYEDAVKIAEIRGETFGEVVKKYKLPTNFLQMSGRNMDRHFTRNHLKKEALSNYSEIGKYNRPEYENFCNAFGLKLTRYMVRLPEGFDCLPRINPDKNDEHEGKIEKQLEMLGRAIMLNHDQQKRQNELLEEILKLLK